MFMLLGRVTLLGRGRYMFMLLGRGRYMFMLLSRGRYMFILLGRGIYGIYDTLMRLNIENDTDVNIMPTKLWDLVEDKRRNEMTFLLFYCARQAAKRHKMTCPGLHLEFLILKT